MKNKNGFCKHGLLLMYCDDCYREYQEEKNKRWIEKQRIIKETYRNYHNVTEPLYNMITGEPIEKEKFH